MFKRNILYLIIIMLLIIMKKKNSINAQTMKTQYSLLESYLNIFLTAAKYQSDWVFDTTKYLSHYDFIIIGGGTAGCVLANRLSENPNINVLLLEAGTDELFIYDIPVMANYFQLTEPNWGHKSTEQKKSCLGFDNQQCKLPRGKVLGGSSVLNYMIYTRGHPRDYDRWSQQLQDETWNFQHVEKYFKKLENFKQGSSERGKNGPVILEYAPFHTEIAYSFLKAVQEFNFSVGDYNANVNNFNFIESHLHNGIRYSANRAYTMKAKYRNNLHVSKHSLVTKILINKKSKKAYGVEFVKQGSFHHIFVNKEIILSAGSLNSPHLLMLSGIGPSDHLKEFNIDVISDLKVGYNLQDHVVTGAITFLLDKNISIITERILNSSDLLKQYFFNNTGPLSVPGGVEALGFINSKYNNDPSYPDLELFLGSGSLHTDITLRRCIGLKDEIYEEIVKPYEGKDSFALQPMIMRPKSRGRVFLKSKDPFDLPLVNTNYLDDKRDVEILIEGVKIARNIILNSNEFKKYNTRSNDLKPSVCKHHVFDTDLYWECLLRHLTINIYHQSGTCKMGIESDDSVVNSKLQVHGIKNLRVVDASVMPNIITGHTNGPVLMIAEKAADMIKSTWNL